MVELTPIADGFQITPHLAVKINQVDKGVYAYVNGKEVRQCRYALITAPIDAEVEDADELIGKYGLSEKESRIAAREISLEEELFVHASNLQAWVESNYDAHIIHTNLAWPLLQVLSDLDQHVRERFLEQVHERWEQGNEKSRDALWLMAKKAVRDLIDAGIISLESLPILTLRHLRTTGKIQEEILRRWDVGNERQRERIVMLFRGEIMQAFQRRQIKIETLPLFLFGCDYYDEVISTRSLVKFSREEMQNELLRRWNQSSPKGKKAIFAQLSLSCVFKDLLLNNKIPTQDLKMLDLGGIALHNLKYLSTSYFSLPILELTRNIFYSIINNDAYLAKTDEFQLKFLIEELWIASNIDANPDLAKLIFEEAERILQPLSLKKRLNLIQSASLYQQIPKLFFAGLVQKEILPLNQLPKEWQDVYARAFI